mmetsp:Transcript_66570/g.205866  ORF Transcript_66570/g.205866 Transcript_66570/m.205866 type:complete len:778 (+) Transcript_66570:81-2414(+)
MDRCPPAAKKAKPVEGDLAGGMGARARLRLGYPVVAAMGDDPVSVDPACLEPGWPEDDMQSDAVPSSGLRSMRLKPCVPDAGLLLADDVEECHEPAVPGEQAAQESADERVFQELAHCVLPDGMHASPAPDCTLSDAMFIVIGTGREAEELCRRRLAGGGHLCVLRTDRPVKGAMVSSKSFWIPPIPRAKGAFSAATTEATGAVRLAAAKEAAEASRCGGAPWKMSINLGTVGPDVHVLAPDEDYALIYDEAMGFTGVCVMDGDGELLWALSGKVVFAGKATNFPGQVCDTMDKARVEDVSVHDEEAKAYPVAKVSWLAVWSLYYLVGMIVLLALGAHFEPRFEGAGLPFWRMAFPLVLAGPCSVGGFDRTVVKAFTGVELRSHGALGEIPFVVAVYALSYMFMANFGGVTYTFSGYLAIAVGTVCTIFPMLVVSLVAARYTRSVRRTVIVDKWDWKHQAWWGVWITCGTFGSWLAFYAVAMGFVFAVPTFPAAANFCLPLLTTLVETTFVAASSFVYDLTLCGSGRMSGTFRGDQRMILLCPLFLTHSFAETQKLCSLIGAGVKEPGSGWVISVATGMVSDLVSRSDFQRAAMVRLLPAWFTRNLLVVGVSRVLHYRLRFFIGYPRFIVPFAILVVRAIQGKEEVLFNSTALAILIATLVTEVIADLVMMRHWLPVNTWVLELERFYSEIEPDSAYQILHFDCRGGATGCARHLRNLRYVDFVRTGGWMAPVVIFPLCLFQLLLGPAYIYGMCEAPLDTAKLFSAALLWQAPLLCS